MYDVCVFSCALCFIYSKKLLNSPDTVGDHFYYSQCCATLLFCLSSFMCRLECTWKHQAEFTHLGPSELG